MDSPQEQGVPPPPTTTAPTIGEISKTSLTLPYLGNDDDVERTDRVNVQPNIDHPPHLEIESMYVPSMVEEEYIHVESERRHPRPNKTTTFASTFTSSLPSKTKNHPHYLPRSPFQHRDKVVGLKDAATKRSVQYRRQEFLHTQHSSMDTLAGGPTTPTMTKSIEDKERLARGGEITNPLSILFLGNLAAFKVMIFYLITAETIVTCMLTAGMIIYWYSYGLEDHLYENPEGISSRLWSGSGMDFVVLIFAVTSPVSIPSPTKHIAVSCLMYHSFCHVDCNRYQYGLYSTGRIFSNDFRNEKFGTSYLSCSCFVGLARRGWTSWL